MGGGTGSGLGTYVLTLLADEYPDVFRFVTAVFPSVDDDVVTSPYNSILALNKLTEHAHCVLPVENQALSEICGRINKGGEYLPRPLAWRLLVAPAVGSQPRGVLCASC